MKTPRIVGKFIRERRESLSLSQRALGQLFEPPVTTQFISNVERGVTPLPPAHVPTLAKALGVGESEMMALLQQEYAMKLSGRVSKDGSPLSGGISLTAVGPGAAGNPNLRSLEVEKEDYEFMRQLYQAYQQADDQAKKAFLTVCRSMFKVQGPASAPSGTPTPVKPTV